MAEAYFWEHPCPFNADFKDLGTKRVFKKACKKSQVTVSLNSNFNRGKVLQIQLFSVRNIVL
jgi:hypothetical protein